MLGIDGWGLDVVLWFQSWRTPLLEAVATVFHRVGQFPTFFLLITIIYWSVNRRFGIRLIAWTLGGFFVNLQVKALVDYPRPFFDAANSVDNIVSESRNGLPSGHAQVTVSFWGMAATRTQQRRLWIMVGVYALLMGVSRTMAGVHYPQDVLVGWLIGIGWLTLYVLGDGPLTDWLAARTLATQVALAAALAVPMFLFAADGALFAGMALGVGVGAAFTNRWARFDVGGLWWQHLLRNAVGIGGLAILGLSLKTAFDAIATEGELGELLEAVNVAVIAFWLSFLGPLVFLRSGLARPE